MTRKKKIEAKTLCDKQVAVIVRALLNTPVDRQ